MDRHISLKLTKNIPCWFNRPRLNRNVWHVHGTCWLKAGKQFKLYGSICKIEPAQEKPLSPRNITLTLFRTYAMHSFVNATIPLLVYALPHRNQLCSNTAFLLHNFDVFFKSELYVSNQFIFVLKSSDALLQFSIDMIF